MTLSPDLLHQLRHHPDADLANSEHQRTIVALLDEIDDLRAQRDDWRQRAEGRAAKAIQEIIDVGRESPKDELTRLKALRGKFCEYGGGIEFTKCEHYCSHLAGISSAIELETNQ